MAGTIALVDAFTNLPFHGNPAGVCLVEAFPNDEIMQGVAFELNWSETAFLVKLAPNKYQIRWFSPMDEAPMCGHATLAAAHFLFEYNYVIGSSVEFESTVGPLVVARQVQSSDNSWLVMDFPAMSLCECDSEEEIDAIREILGAANIERILKDSLIYIVVLSSAAEVSLCTPDLQRLATLPCRAISITSAASDGCDFVSRYFAPVVGIPEDPVCGSSHCRLVPLWADALRKDTLVARQLSKRGGTLRLSYCRETKRVTIAGQATIIFKGELAL
jgi:PhzF family phenazine biosynthesis protein